FGHEYVVATKYVAILIPATALAAGCYFFGVCYYLPESRGAVFSSLLAFAVSVVVNISLIPVFGAIVAAIASLLAFAVMITFRYVEWQRLVPCRYQWVGHMVAYRILSIQCVLLYLGVSPPWRAVASLLIVACKRGDVLQVARG